MIRSGMANLVGASRKTPSPGLSSAARWRCGTAKQPAPAYFPLDYPVGTRFTLHDTLDIRQPACNSPWHMVSRLPQKFPRLNESRKYTKKVRS